ncbi:condensation domain-containing protein [Kitasatospora sp. NPDC006697]|uniref:condensation domain-containing protein n=1 Tax=Kitasatospora sp. NPDC006697 TaxID=3364020 RepID=UPI0036A92E6E
MIPVSFGQHRLWLLDRFERTGWTYNTVVRARIAGPLDVAALDAAVSDVVARHEALRTSFPAEDDTPYQSVEAVDSVRLRVAELPGEDAGKLAADCRRVFDLAREPPVRVTLFRVSEQRHVLQLVLHHIVVDGWSVRPLMRDLAQAYAARRAGAQPDWEPLPVQFGDFAQWQREVLGSAEDPSSLMSGQLDFWRSALAGLPVELTLPADRDRPERAGYRGGAVPVATDAELHRRLREIAQECGATLFMVVHAALAALWHRLGAGEDIPVGTVAAGRVDRSLDELVGFFVNTLALRTDLSGNPDFRELIARVRDFDLDAFDHQDVPFEQVVHAVSPERRPGRHPLFQTMLVVQSFEPAEPRFPGLSVEMEQVGSIDLHSAKFDLNLDLAETWAPDGSPAGVKGHLIYAADLWDERSAQAVAERFLVLLTALAADPGARIRDPDLVLDRERPLLLGEVPAEAVGQGAPSADPRDLAIEGELPPVDTLVALLDERPGRRIRYAPSGGSGRAIRILDSEHRLAPPGVLGELHLPAGPTGLTARRRADGWIEFAPRHPAEEPARTAPRTGPAQPITADQQVLCGIFADILGVESVGIHEDFFDLGGQSLMAVRVAGQVRKLFDVELDLSSVFRAPTVAELDALIRQATRRTRLVPQRGVPRPDPLPLAPAQLRLWMLDQIQGPSASYNVPLGLRLRGELDAEALGHALNDVIGRHEALRTVFPDHLGEPYQHTLAAPEAQVELRRARCGEGGLADLLAGYVAHVFRLDEGPLLRAHLVEVGPQEHVLLLLMHHIVSDGGSIAPMLTDLAAAYDARRTGQAPRWTGGEPLQYADYTVWQLAVLGDPADPDSTAGRQLDHWRRELADLPTEVTLPPDLPGAATAASGSGTVPVSVDRELHRGLARVARETGTTLFMVLHAGYAVLLARLGAGTDLPIGTPVAGRPDEAFDELVGFVTNTLVLRSDLSQDVPFRRFLQQVRDTDVAAFRNQDLPFDQVVQDLNPPRSATRNPFFQVGFALEHHAPLAFSAPGLEVRTEIVPGVAAKLDLDLTLTEHWAGDGEPGGITGILDFPVARYDRGTVTKAVEEYLTVLAGIVADPDVLLSALGVGRDRA